MVVICLCVWTNVTLFLLRTNATLYIIEDECNLVYEIMNDYLTLFMIVDESVNFYE